MTRRHLPLFAAPAVFLALLFATARPAPATQAALSVVVQHPVVSADVDAAVSEAIGDIYAQRLGASKVFSRLVTMNDVLQMVRHERTKAVLGCDDSSSSCLAEVAGALGATHLALLQVTRLGTGYVLGARLIDLRTARVLFRQSRTIPALEAAVPVVEDLARNALASVEAPGEGGGTEEGVAEGAQRSADRRDVAQATVAEAQKAAQAAEAARLRKVEEEESGMVLVPGGAFYFGCNATLDRQCLDNEKPGRVLELPAFKIDRTEVTYREFERCVDAGACTVPDDQGYACVWGRWFRGKHPVNCVDWSQAKAFCAWKGRRLPTAREWEKAARGAEGRVYPWGNDLPAAPPAALAGTADEPLDVGSFLGGESPYGALDMAGNVAEWTASTYDDLRYEYRGGGFLSSPQFARSSDRHRAEAPTRRGDLGFRCAL